METMNFKSDIHVEPIQSVGGDHMVVSAARVSTQGAECLEYAKPESAKDNAGLINFLMKHRHGTPFEHSSLTFFVDAPIFVWREWHRHRIGFSYNETSGRYKQLEPVFYIPPNNRPLKKIDSWKPGKPKFATLSEPDGFDDYAELIENLKYSYKVSYKMYERNLEMGFDPGIARACLPVGIYSQCWVTCNPRSLMAFLSLRTYEPERATFVSYPLYEIEVAARACENIFAEGWPITYKAFCDNGRVAP